MSGAASPALLLFEPLAPGTRDWLEESHRVVPLAPAGAGELIEALGGLEGDAALLVTREEGAAMAIEAAADRPELVRGLILIDASPGEHWDEWSVLERPALVVREPSGSLSIRDAVKMVNRQPRAKLVEVGRPEQLGAAAQAWLRSLVD